MTRTMRNLTRTGLVVLGAALALSTVSDSAQAYWRGCWGCGAFAAGAVAGAVIARPYAPPVYYTAPVVVAPPVVVPAPVVAPAPVYAYPVCPALPPYPYYCR
jgi:hypothetical protein